MDRMLRASIALRTRVVGVRQRAERDERGDVPGWVMIVVMTAGLVAMLTLVAGPQLRDMLTTALDSVAG
jgi:hypothetical protein